jgi:hypothetical protein
MAAPIIPAPTTPIVVPARLSDLSLDTADPIRARTVLTDVSVCIGRYLPFDSNRQPDRRRDHVAE